MGIKDWFDRKRRGYTDIDELMNPLVAGRLQHFVCIRDADDRPFLRHYFQFLDKHGIREEYIVFYGRNPGGYSYERTAYRKQGDEQYSLLNENSPWWATIKFLQGLGQRLPANTQSPEGHHAAGVRLEHRPRQPEPAPRKANPAPALIKTAHGFTVGEHVVYPEHGVGTLLAIERQEIAGACVDMFVIHFKNDKMTLRVPTTKFAAGGLRRLADEI